MIFKVIFGMAILSTLTLTLPCRAVDPHGGAYSGGIREGDIITGSSSHGENPGMERLLHEATRTKVENVERGRVPNLTSFLADPAAESLADL